ncbi:MAG: YciK family oxidoreductase [Gammaproteobacteria bacterium]|nr:YciK family oxidoreductase [Gammaproteobacteria bacterium]
MPAYHARNDLLKDRVILVTGAGDGIGKAAALSFAAHGATVVLLGKTVKKLEKVYDEIVAAGGPQPAIYPMNLEGSGPEHYAELAATLDREFGRLDGLVHNAAWLGSITPIEHYPADQWLRVLHINLNAPFLMTQALLPVLKKSDSASVLFTSSGVGRKGRAYWGAYAVSKFGIEGLAQVLADELENNTAIRVNCINPGATRTQMRAIAFPGEDPQTLPTPADIMPAYLYLMGADSRETRGQSLDARDYMTRIL